MREVPSFLGNVSRETLDKLMELEGLVAKWSGTINLISAKSAEDIWNRHILDSAQLIPLQRDRPPAHWLDFGSGGGFPAIVCAIIAKDAKWQTRFTLIEADERKSIFLDHVSKRFDLPISLRNARLESITPFAVDTISARAFAPLPRLLPVCAPFCGPTTTMLFHKGERVGEELTRAQAQWHMDAEHIDSVTDSSGVILRIKNLRTISRTVE